MDGKRSLSFIEMLAQELQLEKWHYSEWLKQKTACFDYSE